MPRKRRQSKKQSRQESEEPSVAVKTQPTRSDPLEHSDESPLSSAPTSALTSALTSAQWTTLRKKILADQTRQPPGSVFGDSIKKGSVYRWGLSAMSSASTDSYDETLQWLTRLATGAEIGGKRFRDAQVDEMIVRFEDSMGRNDSELCDVHEALVWAAAMPGLLNHLDEAQWWNLLGTIQELRERLAARDATQPSALIGVAELGLTLAWRLRALPSCRRLAISSQEALAKWCEQDDLAVSAALANPHHTRVVLASLLRIRMLLPVVDTQPPAKKKTKAAAKSKSAKSKSAKRKKQHQSALSKAIDEVGVELTAWVAAMARNDGSSAFSIARAAKSKQASHGDDLGPSGLLSHAAKLDRETLEPAIKAALGKTKTKGRLAWQANLPESMLHDEDAKVVCMLPEWDVRRGRTIIDYREPTTALELTAGKSVLISGRCETSIVIGERPIEPVGDWVATCEYTDDDVHYIELEQPHSDGYVLQRQVMVVREDRCFFFADAVVQSQFALPPVLDSTALGVNADSSPLIQYQIRFPLGDSTQANLEAETNDLFLEACGRDQGRRHALVMPLSAAEWRNSPQMNLPAATLQATEDNHLLLTSKGRGQLYAPLWIDLSRQRFLMNRTWRQLTVGEKLKSLPPQTAVAFRVQVGKSQWILYRSMAPPAPRTFLGRHMIADFYCARLNAKERSYEDLITVEDN